MKRMGAGILAAGAVVTLLACSGSSEADQPPPDRGQPVLELEPGDQWYQIYRSCQGTTGIYSMKDYHGWDFQVVPSDPSCQGAK